MTRFLGAEVLDGRLNDSIALQAMEQAFELEAKNGTTLPDRVDAPSTQGFLRVMPGVLDDVMGLKVMTLAEGLGTRYLVLLYAVETGELLAIFDADEMTRFRTAATTALAGRLLVPVPPRRLGLVGSGFEAVGQLRALAALWPLEEVQVYSPTRENREHFAAKMTKELGFPVRPVESHQDATADQQVVVLATKSDSPVVHADTIPPACVVLSIGSTRRDLRELDRGSFARAGTVVGDSPDQLQVESGDVADAVAAGVLDQARFLSLAALCTNQARPAVDDDHDLIVFKSVGTALQDLAIARAAYRDAVARNYGDDLGELSRLKPFAPGN
ncbi:MAG: ornithine cyclodeaminase family protein [Acidimicrobiia bacterium]